MKAPSVLRSSAVLLLLCTITGCRAGHSGTAVPPSLYPVPTSAWRPGDISALALATGTLQGGYEHGTFCVWLTPPIARAASVRQAIVWPAGYHVRPHPLELLDAHNVVVAKDGDLISFGGGGGPVQPGPCMLGQTSAFYVNSTVSVTRHTLRPY